MHSARIFAVAVFLSGCIAATSEPRRVITDADDPAAPTDDDKMVPDKRDLEPEPELEIIPDPDDPEDEPDPDPELETIPDPELLCEETAAEATANRPLSTDDGVTLRWNTATIAVSYEPALSGEATAIAQAVDQWRAAPCDYPGLGSPEPRMLSPFNVFSRIHFVAETQPSPSGLQQTSTATNADTGEILGVRIWVNPNQPESSEYYARNIGHALGLRESMTDNSVLPWNDGSHAPTCGDLMALCEHYK